MGDFCPFTNNTCEKEICALWLKDLERCSLKEIALQIHELRRELGYLKVDIGSIPHKIKIKT